MAGRRACVCAALALLAAGALSAQEAPVTLPQQEIAAQSYAPLVERTAPAVVNIFAQKVTRTRAPLFDGTALWRLFSDTLLFGYGQDRISNSLGSGVIVSADGVIVTNVHVIDQAQGIEVALTDGRSYAATLLLADPRTDIAVLRIKPEMPLPFLSFSDSDALRVGDQVLAIGNPFGLGQTVTGGIVSAVARTSFGIGDFRFFIQTDAAINPGNSGGAQIDLKGLLVGINTAIYTTSGGSQGLGFAVPSNMVKPIVESAVSGQPLVHPWLGISGRSIPPQFAAPLGLASSHGVIVIEAHKSGPAAAAGITIGDVILAVEGGAVNDPLALRYRIATRKAGETLRLIVVRSGRRYEVKVTVVAPPAVPARDDTHITAPSPFRGARVANLSPALAEELGADSGISGVIVLAVGRRSAAARLGLKSGDIIRNLDGREVLTVSDLTSFRITPFKPWKLTLTRAGQNMEIGQLTYAGFKP